jgi:hypothetical protein
MSDFGNAERLNKVGLEVWRIEKFSAKPVDKKTYGQLFSGDCYLCLWTVDKQGVIYQDLHFWLGKDSTQDEQGTSAFKTVELDDLLGGRPVQHREVQGYESEEFLSLFKPFGGLRYMEGGIAGGFKKVERDAYTPRLFQLKGKRNVRCTQVEMKASSMNEGDVFILDLGLTLYQWNGKEANKNEKFKGLEMVTKIKDEERGGRAQTTFLESGKNDEKDEKFWKALGGSKRDVKTAAEAGDDDKVKSTPPVLYQISDASGSLAINKIAEEGLDHKMLDRNDVFVLDTGSAVFVWIGGGASKDERNKGMTYGQNFLTENNRPAWTPLTRCAEGGETAVFKSYFGATWPQPKREEKKAAPKEKKYNVGGLYKREAQETEKMADDGGGDIKIWRINNMAKEEVQKNMYGQFFAGDSFIILYTYKVNGKELHIIYFWQGKDSSQDEKGASALLAMQMDDEMGGEPVQVRVVQGKEPNHFLTLFKGRMIVHEGGVASGFKNRKDKDSFDSDGVSLFHIKGTSALNTRGVQVAEVASSLNSGDCFTLLTPNTVYIWKGTGASAEEQKVAANITAIIQGSRKVVKVDEGKEPAAFWDTLGGKTEYASGKDLGDEAKEPRLFQLTTAGDGFTVTEVFNFNQDDLIKDDVMLLDTFTEVFVWLGSDCSREEKDLSIKTALEYVANAPDGRSKDTPVFKIIAGAEPPNFTAHFLGWDAKKACDFSDQYLKALSAMKAAGTTTTRATSDDIGYKPWATTVVSLDDLKAGKVANVDPSKKELYLSDEVFKKLFATTKKEWEPRPAWKKNAEKKKHGLF